jgi:competence protein ComEC
MHIVILSSILVSLFLSLGFWRGQAFYLTVLIISIYILMIGLPASALRASIMVFLFLLGQKLGRLSFSYRTVIFAALIMLIANPFLLKDDIGFQLSFLAVFGIISFSSFFEEQLRSLFGGNLSGIISIVALTLSAQVFTLPLLIYNFGYFSLVGPITNLLIVPCLSYLIILSLVFFLAVFVYPLLGSIFSWLVYLLLSYFVFIISLFNTLPLAALRVHLSWHWLCLFYCFLLFFLWKKRKIRN